MKILTSDLNTLNTDHHELFSFLETRNHKNKVKVQVFPSFSSVDIKLSDKTVLNIASEQYITIYFKNKLTRIKAGKVIGKKFKMITCSLFFKSKEIPFSSWILGFWLGCKIKKTKLIFPDNCLPILKKELRKNKWFLDSHKNCIKSLNNNNTFEQQLFSYGLDDETCIPDIFLKNSFDIRGKLISGLEAAVFSEKPIKKEFTMHIQDCFLRRQILWLYRSLNFRCKIINNFVYINKDKKPIFSATCKKSEDFCNLLKSEKSFVNNRLWLI
jgi:hypothetical protein